MAQPNTPSTPAGTQASVDLTVDANRQLTARLAHAWRDLRRGYANNALRELIFEGDGYSIEPGQLDTLEQLVYHESIRMGDLADVLRIDPSTATRAVQRLIKDGLAEKVSHAGDGRVVFVGPTEHGREVYLKVVERRRLVVTGVMNEISEERRGIVADALDEFNAAVETAVARILREKR